MPITEVDISRLDPPPSRPYADSGKLARMGPFDTEKYTPITVEKAGRRFIIQDGMTRVHKAREAGLKTLLAYVFPQSGE